MTTTLASEAAVLGKCSIFDGLSEAQLAAIATHFRHQDHLPGEVVMREGEMDAWLRVVKEGRVRILKRAASGELFPLRDLGVGETVGEMKLVDLQPNSAEVVAVEPTVTMSLELQLLERDGPQSGVRSVLVENIARQLAVRLRSTTEVTAEALRSELTHVRARLSVASFIVNMFVMFAIYSLSLAAVELLPPQNRPSRTIHSAVLILSGVVPLYLMLRRSGYPLSAFGLTLQGWRKAAWQSLLYSCPVMLVILILKWAWITFDARLSAEPLFNPAAMFGARPFDAGYYAFGVALYVIFSPVQEFFARSALQGSLERLLARPEQPTHWPAILLSNLMFAAAHAHIGFYFCLAAFVPGIFWGWLYARQHSLLGATLSHAVVGLWALNVVGVQTLIIRH